MLMGTAAAAEGRVRQVAVPPAARARSTLAHVDYADAFVLDLRAAQECTAEEWARATVEGAPASVQRQLRRGWTALGLRLGATRSDRFVLGWEVRRNSPDLVLLGAGSRIGMPAELLFERRQHSLLFATFVQHDNVIARAVWAATEPVHVPIVRRVLERAAKRHG
ncbi:MAG: hypothetical protein ACJ756_11855 [Solirubrobacterales bacterium]